MNEARSGNEIEAAHNDLLLRVGLVVQALSVGLRRIVEVSHEAVFVFHPIAKRGVRPGSFGIVSLVLDSGAVDAVDLIRREIEHAIRISVYIEFVVAIEIIETGEVMLPA